MGQENREKVLGIFYEFSAKKFTVREISKLAKIPRATAHKILVGLKKEGMVDGEGRASGSRLFLSRKVGYFIDKIVSSGLVDFLVEEFVPSAIVLFGSVRKGDSEKESDVDIFVESAIDEGETKAMGLDMGKFERRIGHKVELFVKPSIKDFHDGLINNIANGIKLYGSLKIK